MDLCLFLFNDNVSLYHKRHSPLNFVIVNSIYLDLPKKKRGREGGGGDGEEEQIKKMDKDFALNLVIS